MLSGDGKIGAVRLNGMKRGELAHVFEKNKVEFLAIDFILANPSDPYTDEEIKDLEEKQADKSMTADDHKTLEAAFRAFGLEQISWVYVRTYIHKTHFLGRFSQVTSCGAPIAKAIRAELENDANRTGLRMCKERDEVDED